MQGPAGSLTKQQACRAIPAGAAPAGPLSPGVPGTVCQTGTETSPAALRAGRPRSGPPESWPGDPRRLGRTGGRGSPGWTFSRLTRPAGGCAGPGTGRGLRLNLGQARPPLSSREVSWAGGDRFASLPPPSPAGSLLGSGTSEENKETTPNRPYLLSLTPRRWPDRASAASTVQGVRGPEGPGWSPCRVGGPRDSRGQRSAPPASHATPSAGYSEDGGRLPRGGHSPSTRVCNGTGMIWTR